MRTKKEIGAELAKLERLEILEHDEYNKKRGKLWARKQELIRELKG